MINDLKVIAVIPARGGSKGIKKKNIKKLCGKPLIEYTYETAKEVAEIDYLLVSTDDDEILKVALSAGVSVIKRPDELSTDEAKTETCLIHAIDFIEERDSVKLDIVLVLEPTSPLRTKETIKRAIEMIDSGYESILAVKQTTENIGFIKDGFFRTVIKDAPRRRQLRESFYIESSTIYASTVDFLKTTGSLTSDNWGALEVSAEEAQDINTEDDFNYINYLLNRRIKNG
tara:strand:+ start:1360 stop:2049 length:690 start_codon:yes stop_codon:yes gene_type:complete